MNNEVVTPLRSAENTFNIENHVPTETPKIKGCMRYVVFGGYIIAITAVTAGVAAVAKWALVGSSNFEKAAHQRLTLLPNDNPVDGKAEVAKAAEIGAVVGFSVSTFACFLIRTCKVVVNFLHPHEKDNASV